MTDDVTDTVTGRQGNLVTVSVRDEGVSIRYVTAMVTKLRRRPRAHLFINEWLEVRGLTVQGAAAKLGIERESLHRWIREQNRLNPVKIARLALVLDIEPEQLWRPPNQISLDALLANTDNELRNMAADIVRRLVKDSR